MQDEYRFNAFGRLLAVVRSNGRWAVFDLGTEGKRRPANLHVPSALAADELAQYLGDLLHENASPKYNDVVPVPLPRRA
ncbi:MULTISPECIES: hypothetical protein [unclassified Burkholderia]|uniref:DUF7661 family protein n=1 Tax=unclassified Burkholderia TaxID=2613784 RepID=UPI000F5A9908|nr:MULTISPECIES: hypothetical protein [unclassified Burkholderia]RQS56065.1 hypothetical protein DID99_11155 [Burkholderia sp. Bp8986]RQS61606.1 hypothetical protein DID98_09375 [Burkholderia sp. Bp8984]